MVVSTISTSTDTILKDYVCTTIIGEEPDIFAILRLLSSKGDLTQRDLSTRLGFSLGKTNYLLRELVKIGLLEIRNFALRDRKITKVRYFLTKRGIEAKVKLTYDFLKEKEHEYNLIKKEWEQYNLHNGEPANVESAATEDYDPKATKYD